MQKRIAIILGSILLVLNIQSLVDAQQPTVANDQKARTVVQNIGVGPKAKLEVKLRDGRKIKGTVSSSSTDSFTVDDKNGASQTILYADVDSARKPRSGLKPRTWAIIAGVGVAAVLVGTLVLYPVLCDGGAGC